MGIGEIEEKISSIKNILKICATIIFIILLIVLIVVVASKEKFRRIVRNIMAMKPESEKYQENRALKLNESNWKMFSNPDGEEAIKYKNGVNELKKQFGGRSNIVLPSTKTDVPVIQPTNVETKKTIDEIVTPVIDQINTSTTVEETPSQQQFDTTGSVKINNEPVINNGPIIPATSGESFAPLRTLNRNFSYLDNGTTASEIAQSEEMIQTSIDMHNVKRKYF